MPPPSQTQLVPVTELRSPKYPKVLTRRPYGRRRPDLWTPLPSQSDTSKEYNSPSSLRASRSAVPVPADVPRWPPVSGSPYQELTPLSERLESQCLATQQLHIAQETPSDSSPAAPSQSSSHVACPQWKSLLHEQLELEAVALDHDDTSDGQTINDDTRSVNCGNGHPKTTHG